MVLAGAPNSWPINTSDYSVEGFDYEEGTSFSAPQVAATMAMMWSIRPDLTVAQLVGFMTSTARPFAVACSGCGAGILDVNAALVAVPRRTGINPPNCKTNPGLCA